MDPNDPTALIRLNRSEPYKRLLSTLSVPTAKKNIHTAIQELDRELSCAIRKYEGGPDGGRLGVRMAIAAAYHFIAAAAPNCAVKFDLFNMVLVAALSDLDRGVVAPLVRKIGHGRDKDSFAYKDIQHRAAATLASLMDIEFDREEAARKVANTLIRNGLRDATPRAVKKWYDERIPADLKRKRGRLPSRRSLKDQSEGHGLYVAATNRLVNYLKGNGYTQKKICDALLHELSYFIQLWFPGAMREASEI